jgi:hypothetical protein
MVCLYQEMCKSDVKLSVMIFLVKVLLNRQKVFQAHAHAWIDVLVGYAMKENKPNGGKGFHYFLRDVVV